MNGDSNMIMFLTTSGCDVSKTDNNGLGPIDQLMSYLARTNNKTPGEVADLFKMMYIDETNQRTLKKKKENKRKNKMKKEKKRNAARQSIVTVTSYDPDPDDEEIDKCDCAECLALNAKMDAEALGI
jgi:hypothetical protein